jgi:flagellar biosynthesis/type III secretory pathway chaperone
MDASLSRDHLERLIVEENGLLAQLEILLDREYGLIKNNDVDALEKAGNVRQSCMGDLIRVEEERRSLCRMSGKSADLHGLEELLKWCDPKGTLQSRWTECGTRATRCRELNDRNGIIVAARLKRVGGMLDILTGRSQAPATYSPQGMYAPAAVGRMVRSEA